MTTTLVQTATQLTSMQLTDIRRQSLSTLTQMDSVLSSLATQAKEILGYDILAKHPGVMQAVELTPLQETLRMLEIDILNSADVLKYQKEMLVERTGVLVREWAKEIQGKNKLHSWDNFRGPAWTQVKISEYKQPIPEFVLAKAVQVKQAFPECELVVEWLEDHPDPFLIAQIPDGREYHPPTEKYYIECWDEPRFEGRLGAGAGEGTVDQESDIPF